MGEKVRVRIPEGNGYCQQLGMLRRVQEHIGELNGVKSAKIESFSNPFMVDIEPPTAAIIVKFVLQRHYGFVISE